MTKQLADLFAEAGSNRLIVDGEEVFSAVPLIPLARRFQVSFLRYAEVPAQGVRLDGKSMMKVGDTRSRQFMFWADSAPGVVEVHVTGRTLGPILVANAWRGPHDAVQAWLGEAGMLVERSDQGVLLKCNSSAGPRDFDDLVVAVSGVTLAD